MYIFIYIYIYFIFYIQNKINNIIIIYAIYKNLIYLLDNREEK